MSQAAACPTTRRCMITGAFVFPVASASAALPVSPDRTLIALGYRFNFAAAEFDAQLLDEETDFARIDVARAPVDALVTEMLRLTARTPEGLQVKARVIRWIQGEAMVPDEAEGSATLMAYSLARDVLALPVA